MSLESLIVTCDPALVGHFQSSLAAHGAAFHLRQDSASAIEFASRRHLDGLMIDCDDVPGGAQALAQVRSTPANNQSLILAIVNGATSAKGALDSGAHEKRERRRTGDQAGEFHETQRNAVGRIRSAECRSANFSCESRCRVERFVGCWSALSIRRKKIRCRVAIVAEFSV